MIISRTPFRISFFGGGTDYPIWYRENSGAVLGTTIDKYCYIPCRLLPPFFEHKYRVVYSQVELVRDIEEIRHPAVREALKFMEINDGVEIHYDGDLPARTGLGTSSSFTVGFLHSLYGYKGIMPSKMQLAKDAIYLEREVLKENVGSQDQVLAAFGGFSRVDFSGEHNIDIKPVVISEPRLESLQNHLMLFFTGLSRTASDVASEQIKQNELSVREAEKLVLHLKEGAHKKPSRKTPLDPDMQRIQDELRRQFGVMVKILQGKKGGKIQIQYASSEELDRIYSILVR